ncbi:coiled-coil domain-containing protein [Paenibacillus kobensis]|uniref:hypothetical protein n=1 Tax=Paenibacillus kobensis TaxID=59841 RepID=UPI000FD909E5|nr:hypothetical protein [Paenibacillus kobensis]
MNELQAQIDQLEAEAAQYRRQGNDTKYNEKITEANQLRQQLETIQSEQTKTEISDVLMQQIQQDDIFGVLFPEDVYQAELSLTVYNDKRQMLNQILHAFAVDIQTQLVDKHTVEKQELATQIRALKDANYKLEDDNIEFEAQLESLKVEHEALQEEMNGKIAAKDAEIANLNEQLNSKQQHIDQLRIDLANAPAPKVAIDVTPASKSFEDVLAAAREKSVKSAADLALSGNNFRGKVILGADGQTPLSSGITPPPVGGSESGESFRIEADTPADAQNDQLPAAEAPPTVEATPTLEQLAERIAILETAVFGQVDTAA